LRAEPKARQVIKRSRWLLLRNPDNLKAEQSIELEELLAANRRWRRFICSKPN